MAWKNNVLPFIKDQTMTYTELEVSKRIVRVGSHVGKTGEFNVNLDLREMESPPTT